MYELLSLFGKIIFGSLLVVMVLNGFFMIKRYREGSSIGGYVFTYCVIVFAGIVSYFLLVGLMDSELAKGF